MVWLVSHPQGNGNDTPATPILEQRYTVGHSYQSLIPRLAVDLWIVSDFVIPSFGVACVSGWKDPNIVLQEFFQLVAFEDIAHIAVQRKVEADLGSTHLPLH